MAKVQFKPGITVINYEYDNPSSGGQIIVTPGVPGHSYLDPATGRIYFYSDGMDGEGWYYFDTESGEMVYAGPNIDVSGMIPQG